MISSTVAAVLFVVAPAISWVLINNPSTTKWIAYTTEGDNQAGALKVHFFAYYGFLLGLAVLIAIMDRVPFISTHPLRHKRFTLGFKGKTALLSLSLPLALLWCAVASFQAWTFWFWYVQMGSRTWRASYAAMGSVASVQLGLTLFPTSRDNVLAQALNVNFDDGLKFHKVSGAWTVVFGVVHFVLYTISTFQTGLTSANKSKYLKKLFLVDIPSDMRTWHAYMGILGLVGTTIFIWVAFNSFSFIRRRSYAWFYINHLLVLFAIIAISLHASTAFYFVLPGILMYAVDGVKRVFYVTAGKRTTITSITRERNNYIRVAISGLTARRLQPGQWISLNVPSIDRIKFHPFTIITVHHTHAGAARGGDVEILVKPSERVGSWTKALEALAGASAAKLPLKSVFVELTTDDAADGKGDDKKAAVTSTDTAFVVSTEHVSGDSAAHDLSIPCLVQGPFGTLPRNFLSSTTVLIVCAGSGVSGGLVIARACLAHTPRPDVRMLWTTHDGGSEEVEAWREMEELKVTEGCLREVTLHRTGGGRGRVDVKALMARWRGEVEGDVSVYTCGPASFTQAVMRESGVFEKRIVHAEGFVR